MDQSTEKVDFLPLLVLKARLDTPLKNISRHQIMLLGEICYYAKICGMKVQSKKAVRLLAIKYERLKMSNLLTWFTCHKPHSFSCHRLWSWPWYSTVRSELCMSVNLTSAYKLITWNKTKSSVELMESSLPYRTFQSSVSIQIPQKEQCKQNTTSFFFAWTP